MAKRVQLSDAVALVTGASSGIGEAVARRLAAAGARTIVHGRDEQRLAAVAAATGGTALTAELSDPAQVASLAEAALAVHGRVDVLINNAGLGWTGPVADMPAGQAERLAAVNLLGPIELTRALLPAMLARRRGHVVFVTSIAGRTAVADEAVYAATKAGLDIFAESLRFELDGTGVGVGVVVPGVVRTAFFQRRGARYGRSVPRPVPPEVIADAVLRTIEGGRAELYRPRWLRLPVIVRSAVPGIYRALAGRFGRSA